MSQRNRVAFSVCGNIQKTILLKYLLCVPHCINFTIGANFFPNRNKIFLCTAKFPKSFTRHLIVQLTQGNHLEMCFFTELLKNCR